MRIFLIPFAAAALFACANYGASAMSLNQTNSIKAGDQAVMQWHLAREVEKSQQASLTH